MENLKKGVKNVIETKSITSKDLIIICLKGFNLSWIRALISCIIFFVFFVFFKTIAFEEYSAINVITEISTMVFSIIVPLFAIIITGYAIFQAMANKLTLEILLEVNSAEKSKLSEFNNYFFGISILYLIVIVINILLFFFFKFAPNNFHLYFFTTKTNECIAAILITIYIIIIVNILIEMKSFIYNLFQVFLTSASAQGLDILRDKKKTP